MVLLLIQKILLNISSGGPMCPPCYILILELVISSEEEQKEIAPF